MGSCFSTARRDGRSNLLLDRLSSEKVQNIVRYLAENPGSGIWGNLISCRDEKNLLYSGGHFTGALLLNWTFRRGHKRLHYGRAIAANMSMNGPTLPFVRIEGLIPRMMSEVDFHSIVQTSYICRFLGVVIRWRSF